jgi:hypothetical protein
MQPLGLECAQKKGRRIALAGSDTILQVPQPLGRCIVLCLLGGFELFFQLTGSILPFEQLKEFAFQLVDSPLSLPQFILPGFEVEPQLVAFSLQLSIMSCLQLDYAQGQDRKRQKDQTYQVTIHPAMSSGDFRKRSYIKIT